MMPVKRVSLVLAAAVLSACATTGIQQSINAHDAVRSEVKLGQSKSEVLRLLAPAQKQLTGRHAKEMETYLHEGKTREIHFIRSRSFNDGIVTDDEFTPYVFEDDVLVAIGWTAIGGPKTQAQTRDDDDVYVRGRYFFW